MRFLQSKRLGFVLLLVAVAAATACEEDTSATSTNYAPLLATLGEDVIPKAHSDFAKQADALASATSQLESEPNSDTLNAAQKAWRSARAAYRRLDALYFGPIADEGIGERIDYSPVNQNGIEAIVAAATPIDASAVAKAGGGAKGFLGIESLIFSSDGTSAALTSLQGDGAAERRRGLVRYMAEEIASSAHQVEDAWAADKGGYANELENAGKGSERYPSQRAAVDDLVGGVGYALEMVVGIRLAEPLGLKSTGSPDPSLDPTAASDSAVADMLASLEGVHALYDGDGLGSKVRAKSEALDAQFTQQLEECVSKLESIPKPFVTALTGDTAKVQSAYDACKLAKATWNADVTSALGATLKPSDNDGD